jgi:hypothetical protein
MHRTSKSVVRYLLLKHPRWMICGLLFCCCACLVGQEQVAEHIELPIAQAENQLRGQDFTLSFDGVAATFKGTSPISVVLERGGTRKTVTLPSEFSQVVSARLYKPDRLIVAGMVNGDASEVVIFDLQKVSVADHFLCYSPSISPNGRYVAFVKFYPTHGDSDVEDHYMLYDASSSPDQNRPVGIPHHPSVVGRVLFPAGVNNRPDDNVDLNGRPTHRMASDNFFWNNQSTLFVFADQYKDEYSAVVARVDGGLGTSKAVGLSREWICPKASQPCFEHLTRVDFPATPTDTSMNLVFRGVNGTPAKESRIILAHANSDSISASPAQ